MNTLNPIVPRAPSCPVPHPVKTLVPLEAAREWAAAEYLIQRKYDGEFGTVEIGGAMVVAEFMRPKSGALWTPADYSMSEQWPGGWWAAWTVAEFHGENLLDRPAGERWGLLGIVSRAFTPDIVLAEVVSCPEGVLAAGGEGVCAHAWNEPYGTMLAHKASAVYV